MRRPKTDRTGERRHDTTGPIRCMADAQAYVMVRRPGAMPFVMTKPDWVALPLFVVEGEAGLK